MADAGLDPWTVIGWILVAFSAVMAIVMPLAVWAAMRARRRAYQEFQRRSEMMDREHSAGLRDMARPRGGRFRLDDRRH